MVVRRAAAAAGALVVGASTIAAASTSCTHGDYDGSFDSSGLEIATRDAGAVVGPPIAIAIAPDATTTTSLTTADGVFEIDVPAHAFASAVTLTITPQADHTIDGPLVVPTYAVAFAPALTATLPIQLVFRGDANANQPSSLLVPVRVAADKTLPLQVVGQSSNGGGGPTGLRNPFWGLTTTGGVFSLAHVAPLTNTGGISEPSTTSCLAQCCNLRGGAGGQLAAMAGACACESVNPNLDCFAGKCPDLAALAARCDALAAGGTGPLACGGAGGPGPGCVADQSVCCVQAGIQPNCGSAGNGTNCTYAMRCTSDANCTNGRVCCAFDDEALCATSCPAERRVCTPAGDGGVSGCDGGTCKATAKCLIGTCGVVPPPCN